MIKYLALFLVFASLLSGNPASAKTDEALNTEEMRKLSPSGATRQVRDDLLSILRPIQGVAGGNTVAVQDVWMHTTASATEYKGLCQRDTLSLFYASTEQSAPLKQRPLRPYKIETTRSYRFVSTPTIDEYLDAQQDDDRRSPFASECDKADRIVDDNEWFGWFDAASPDMAMAGGLAVEALKQWAAVDGNEFTSCTKDDAENCKSRALQFLTLDTLGSVGKCAAGRDEVCWELGRYSDIYQIKARDTKAPIKAEDIISVDHEIMIIVT